MGATGDNVMSGGLAAREIGNNIVVLQVENPIPFASSLLTRRLSIGYLHARYAALLALPVQLSADWSFECIPLVTDIWDPRNAATLVLYSTLAWLVVAGRPWRWRPLGAGREDAVHFARQKYRVVIVLGLMVGLIMFSLRSQACNSKTWIIELGRCSEMSMVAHNGTRKSDISPIPAGCPFLPSFQRTFLRGYIHRRATPVPPISGLLPASG